MIPPSSVEALGYSQLNLLAFLEYLSDVALFRADAAGDSQDAPIFVHKIGLGPAYLVHALCQIIF